MATKAATGTTPLFSLMLVLTIQSSFLHATPVNDYYYGTTDGALTKMDYADNMPRDDDNTRDDAFVAGLEEWETESDGGRFAEESRAVDLYPGVDGSNAGWESFSSATLNTPRGSEYGSRHSTFASTESSSTDEATGVDSWPDNTSPMSGVADDSLEGRERGAYVESDEVYFDTSGAGTIYKASDDLRLTDVSELSSLADDAKGGCWTGNPIDDCWRCDSNWRSHRKALAYCATGFGRNAHGGKDGPIYVVTKSSDDAVEPSPGTLRYGVTRRGPLWIVFKASMTIRLEAELWLTSFKTIDGRGADVHIVGAQITIQNATNVIVHGVSIHDIKVTGPEAVRESPSSVADRPVSDGDALHILNSQKVWVDHCYLARAIDGLLDVTRGSNLVTVSNNLFEHHNKVMLFGSSPDFPKDRRMRATVAYNRFGAGLIQRLPRCRYGAFHIVNNYYSDGWDKYAIGGSEDPLILSQGNVFHAQGATKEVTKYIDDGGPTFGGWQKWKWVSSGDMFLHGSYFTGSGDAASKAKVYATAVSTTPRPASMVPAMTKSAGPISSLLSS